MNKVLLHALKQTRHFKKKKHIGDIKVDGKGISKNSRIWKIQNDLNGDQRGALVKNFGNSSSSISANGGGDFSHIQHLERLHFGKKKKPNF